MTDKTERPYHELVAGVLFRRTVVPRADATTGNGPMWHGWVIMEAFLAGVDWARRRDASLADGETPRDGESNG